MTDKPLEDLSDTSYSYKMWNKAIADMRKKHGEEQVTWFKMSWLFNECYLYRKVIGAVVKTKHLKDFDIFEEQKVEGFNSQPNQGGSRQLHIVLDNAGPELMGDLMLAEYLMGTKLVDKTVLHGKHFRNIPTLFLMSHVVISSGH
ncbi:unnamed protein product [Strongylus vulgaris]|uniref:Sugar phosphate phosphatase n=1 Tax=Strongylus vulgaris TaxID=40348 RepID=A0A3P7IX05_STRVU|nr:unnamed protein product [Strongylus vulgaris]